MTKFVRYDWLSFSYNVDPQGDEDTGWFYGVIDQLEAVSAIAYELLHHELPARGSGRRPYSLSYGNRLARVFCSPSNSWPLCEINGTGCEHLTDRGRMGRVIQNVRARVTRIDIAIDIEVGDDNRVDEFISAGYSDRFKTKSDVNSSTGRTHYIGSRTSERMCRVYQYKPPHPRSNLLRIEFELKGDRAKQLAAMTSENTVRDLAVSLVEAYGFRSPMLGTEWAEKADFEPLRGKQRHNNTIAWIHKQVVPAVKKLVREGVIEDLDKFLEEAFKGGD